MNDYSRVVLKPKGAWWTRHESSGTGQCGRCRTGQWCTGWWGTRGNGVRGRYGHQWYPMVHLRVSQGPESRCFSSFFQWISVFLTRFWPVLSLKHRKIHRKSRKIHEKSWKFMKFVDFPDFRWSNGQKPSPSSCLTGQRLVLEMISNYWPVRGGSARTGHSLLL